MLRESEQWERKGRKGNRRNSPAVGPCLPNPGCRLSCHKCLHLSVDHGPYGLHTGGSLGVGRGSRGWMGWCSWSLDQVLDRIGR